MQKKWLCKQVNGPAKTVLLAFWICHKLVKTWGISGFHALCPVDNSVESVNNFPA